VFNENHIVEGVLSIGDKDFLHVGNCARTNNCPSAGCPGDTITRTTRFAEFVPQRPIYSRANVLPERLHARQEFLQPA
jgi:hypothetical protein